MPEPLSGQPAKNDRPIMQSKRYDIIVIGCGSGGLSVGLFMGQAGFKVLMVSKSDHAIGGDCLNDGCVPSKALLHVAKTVYAAREAAQFGLQTIGAINFTKATAYVHSRQEIIREHENAEWLRKQGVEVALGLAHFTGKNEIEVEGKRYSGKKIVIATGSRPRKLNIPGVELVRYYDNESIFHLEALPEQLLVIGGGPIGIEITQAISRMGSKVTVVQRSTTILPSEDKAITDVVKKQLEKEGVRFFFGAAPERFSSANEAVLQLKDGSRQTVSFDAVFAGIGRQLNIENLQLQNAGVDVKSGKIVVDNLLRTTNKDVFVCGDVAGSLQFSHAAEYHARILLNNFFSPLKKKLHYNHFSWVTFTDPEVATFGLNEKTLKEKGIPFERLEENFEDDDRAVTDDYQYGKLVLFISRKRFLKKQKILGGTMVAPGAGELIQELILANEQGLSINALFNKIYPYPVASRINQKAIVMYKQNSLTGTVKKLLQTAYKIFS